MKLHLACGNKYLSGYVNVDIAAPRLDLSCDLSSARQREEVFRGMQGKVEEVLCVHFIEHLVPWEVPGFLQDCHALLREGGQLVLELPDLLKCVQNILKSERDQLGMWGLYGNPGTRNTYMLHRWAYTPETLSSLLRDAGFDALRIAQNTPHWHASGRYNRDMRLEATR